MGKRGKIENIGKLWEKGNVENIGKIVKIGNLGNLEIGDIEGEKVQGRKGIQIK